MTIEEKGCFGSLFSIFWHLKFIQRNLSVFPQLYFLIAAALFSNHLPYRVKQWIPGHRMICFRSALRNGGSQVHESLSAMPAALIPRLSDGQGAAASGKTARYYQSRMKEK